VLFRSDWSEQKKEFSHLKKIPFPKLPKQTTISILIGTDYNKLFKPQKIVDNPENDNDPWAVLTPLGWTCIGASAKSKSKSKTSLKTSSQNHMDSLNVVFQNILFEPKQDTKESN